MKAKLRVYQWLWTLLLSCMMCFQSVQAADADPRMTVLITNETNMNKAMTKALQALWQRVVPQAFVASIPGVQPSRFLPRVQTQHDGTWVHFNAAQVWTFLEASDIPHLRDIEPLALEVGVYFSYGMEASEASAELKQFVQAIAPAWGVQLNPQAAAKLWFFWEWLDDGKHIRMTMRTSELAPEREEVRMIPASAQAMQTLKQWTLEALLQVRDMQWQIHSQEATAQEQLIRVFRLQVQRADGFPEQVALEQALLQDERVVSVTPMHLAQDKREYRILLRGADIGWVSDWLLQHGMAHVLQSHEGWLAK